jgi:hypothetical protein
VRGGRLTLDLNSKHRKQQHLDGGTCSSTSSSSSTSEWFVGLACRIHSCGLKAWLDAAAAAAAQMLGDKMRQQHCNLLGYDCAMSLPRYKHMQFGMSPACCSRCAHMTAAPCVLQCVASFSSCAHLRHTRRGQRHHTCMPPAHKCSQQLRARQAANIV